MSSPTTLRRAAPSRQSNRLRRADRWHAASKSEEHNGKEWNMVTTSKGRNLAIRMMKHFDADKVSTFDLAVPLSRLCRMAPAYHRIQEAWCNGDMTDRVREQTERRERIIEARAALIVASMPAATTGPLELVLTGDPRGYTMRVKVPGAEHDGNTWGLGGEYGVG